MSWQDFYERCVAEERKRWDVGPSLKDRAWYIGPFMVTTIFGRKGEDPYKTDVQLGSLALHIFWRGDVDPDPHDHQHDFWTFPFVGYSEVVYDKNKGRPYERFNQVKPWRLHHRKAEYAHRVDGRLDGKSMLHGRMINGVEHYEHTTRRPIVTLVWRGRKRREWGFWRWNPTGGDRIWTPWREYIGRPT